MYSSRSFLCKLKTKLNEVTDLTAKKEAESNQTAVPYNVASLSQRNSSNGSAKRKRLTFWYYIVYILLRRTVSAIS
jgi:hypothetical protein